MRDIEQAPFHSMTTRFESMIRDDNRSHLYRVYIPAGVAKAAPKSPTQGILTPQSASVYPAIVARVEVREGAGAQQAEKQSLALRGGRLSAAAPSLVSLCRGH